MVPETGSEIITMKAVTSEQMKRIDRLAEEKYGIPSIVLMENAGRKSAEEILKKFNKGKAALFCGRGNNGGDGFVCARYLKNAGIKPVVFLVSKYRDIKNRNPHANLSIIKKMGIKIQTIDSETKIKNVTRGFGFDFIVDAIFGIGFKGSLTGHIAKIVDFINKTKKPVFSLDVPSGLDATSGKIEGPCVVAFRTITFGLPKKGFFKKKAKRYLGKLIVKNIGFPRGLLYNI